MSTIAILGSGRVGQNLAEACGRAGHTVMVGSRRGPIDHETACRNASIVVNALPGAASLQALIRLGGVLRGKVLIDLANATTRGSDGLPEALVHPGGSLGEEIQRALPETRVVKALNTMLYTVMTNPTGLSSPVSAFLSGDDPTAKRLVADLLVDLGWPTAWILDLGGIATAQGPESFALFLRGLASALGRGRNIPPFGLAIAR